MNVYRVEWKYPGEEAVQSRDIGAENEEEAIERTKDYLMDQLGLEAVGETTEEDAVYEPDPALWEQDPMQPYESYYHALLQDALEDQWGYEETREASEKIEKAEYHAEFQYSRIFVIKGAIAENVPFAEIATGCTKPGTDKNPSVAYKICATEAEARRLLKELKGDVQDFWGFDIQTLSENELYTVIEYYADVYETEEKEPEFEDWKKVVTLTQPLTFVVENENESGAITEFFESLPEAMQFQKKAEAEQGLSYTLRLPEPKIEPRALRQGPQAIESDIRNWDREPNWTDDIWPVSQEDREHLREARRRVKQEKPTPEKTDDGEER